MFSLNIEFCVSLIVHLALSMTETVTDMKLFDEAEECLSVALSITFYQRAPPAP